MLGLVPRAASLLDGAEVLLDRIGLLLDRVDETRAGADQVIARTETTRSAAADLVAGVEVTRARADEVVAASSRAVERIVALLDALEPSLVRLQPTLERLAETTDPAEVDALVELVDRLPLLADRFEADVLPVLGTLQSVGPDLRELLDIASELSEVVGKVPGMGRIKKRVEEEHAAEAPQSSG